jgi:hypothetical protein
MHKPRIVRTAVRTLDLRAVTGGNFLTTIAQRLDETATAIIRNLRG